MTPHNFLMPAFDHEMAVTRRLLARIPDEPDVLAWRPHDRSFSLAELAGHLAVLPQWGRAILDHDDYDLTTSAGRPPATQPSRAAVLAVFDEHVAAVRARLVAMAGVELDTPWRLRRGAQVLMELPRHAAFRRFLIDHTIHHRGQLTVYLRLRDIPLPPIYGASADEGL